VSNKTALIWFLFLDRYLVDINPAKGSKSFKGKKTGSTICQRTLKLIKKLNSFHQGSSKFKVYLFVHRLQLRPHFDSVTFHSVTSIQTQTKIFNHFSNHILGTVQQHKWPLRHVILRLL
jgi:hypothetical protein